jgi:hypothetical protein
MMSQPIVVGSEAHKQLLCQFFTATHVPFTPEEICWPEIDAESLVRLRSLPFWVDAVATECQTACTIQTWAAYEADPLLREAVALQAYEEARHAALLHRLTTHYEISLPPLPAPQPPVDPEWAFLCTGYSECFDAFFSFALLAIAQASGFFPSGLVALFEPIMQEEARHILFFVNWEAYKQAHRPLWQRPRSLWRGVLGRGLQVWYRLQMARGMPASGDFTLTGHHTMQSTLTPRRFLELCLQENARRLSGYDARLLRPRLVPAVAQALCRVLP